MARTCATAGHDGWQATPCRHQQARQQISSQAAHPWCSCRPARDRRERHATRWMATKPDEEGAQERRRGRAGKQVGAHRMGGAPTRGDVQRRPDSGGLVPIGGPRSFALIDRLRFAGGGKRDGLTVERRPGTLVQKTAQRRRGFYEDRDVRISILAGAVPRDRIR